MNGGHFLGFSFLSSLYGGRGKGLTFFRSYRFSKEITGKVYRLKFPPEFIRRTVPGVGGKKGGKTIAPSKKFFPFSLPKDHSIFACYKGSFSDPYRVFLREKGFTKGKVFSIGKSEFIESGEEVYMSSRNSRI